MTKKELIKALASSTGAPRVDAERALAGLLEIVTDTLKKGNSVCRFLDLAPSKSGTVPLVLVETQRLVKN